MNFKSNTINFRFVEETDAAFVNSLRVDEKYNQYLSHVDDDVSKQLAWIKKYKQREHNGDEYYFIIQRNDNQKPIGTVRIYDFIPNENSFCWGSWILNEDKTKYAALECTILIYDFAFIELGYNRCHMDIRKGNTKVVDFHKKFGVRIVAESEIDYFGYYYKDDYLKIRDEIVDVITKKYKLLNESIS